jgi:hypothetical protein
MASMSIRSLMDKVTAGTIRIPAFQRGFVWDGERVAFFMDSLYKGYPFGSILLWRTRSKLNHERRLGPFELQDVDVEYPIDYVLDGQQRLTSLFGVFQTELTPAEADPRFDVYFDITADETLQGAQFFALTTGEIDSSRHFPMNVLFDVTRYRKATELLEGEQLTVVDGMYERFKEIQIPTQTFETDDKARVAIVFERVNRLGVELDVLQLLSAWTWSEDFYLQDKFEALGEELEPFGFALVGDDTNLLLRCCAAVIKGQAAPNTLMTLDGNEVRERFDEITNGINGAIDFLITNLHVRALKNLPFGTLIVPLSVFFAASGNESVDLSAEQRTEILRWFWRSCFSRRYSSDVIRKLEVDIAEMRKLKDGENNSLADIPGSANPEFFLDATFNTYGVNTKCLILLLAQYSPRSFISGAPVGLGQVLKAYNRNEFHHCYPRAFLKEKGLEPKEYNKLANFVFMSAIDNKRLGGDAPSVYRECMYEPAIPGILEHAVCPERLFNDNYTRFVNARAEMLAAAATGLCTDGEPPKLSEVPVDPEALPDPAEEVGSAVNGEGD